MRGKAVLVLPLAALFTHGFFSKAADSEGPGPLPDITKDDLQNIALRLKNLASGDFLGQLAGQLGDEGVPEVDPEYVQKALDTLTQLVSKSEASGLLEDLSQATEGTLRQALKADSSGEEDDPVETILSYFLSLRRVLSSNEYLRRQVNLMIQENAGKLLTASSLGEVLNDIMRNPAFMDLEEEIKEDMQSKAGFVLESEEGGDMSR